MESYKETIIGNLKNTGTPDLFLHSVQLWSASTVDEENLDLPMVLYCSRMIYKYYSHLECITIIHNKEGRYIHK